MGIIRFILAFCVVLGHAGPGVFHGAVLDSWIAVQGFYIISGFYISMVLAGSYTSIVAFWTNRMLRLLPVYYAALLLAAWAYWLGNGVSYFHDFKELPPAPMIFMAFNQATLIFQDLTLFVGIQHGHFGFVRDGSDSIPILRNLLLIPQAWSLGVEISFYFIAPFVLGRPRLLGTLFFLSLLLRFVLIRQGYSGDPWSYRFFPNEIALFLLGAIAHKLYARKKDYFKRSDLLAKILLIVVLAAIAFWSRIPIEIGLRKVLFFSLLAGSLPYIFALSKDHSVDRFIANLSYPIYLTHYALMTVYNKKIGPYEPAWGQVGLYSLIIAVSVILYLAIDRPVDRIRARIKQRAQPVQTVMA